MVIPALFGFTKILIRAFTSDDTVFSYNPGKSDVSMVAHGFLAMSVSHRKRKYSSSHDQEEQSNKSVTSASNRRSIG